jgi:benzodiazapine receptor
MHRVLVLLAPLAIGTFTGRLCKMPETESLPMRPPRWAFPVVWTLLYLILGYVALHVFGFMGKGVHRPTALVFLAHLGLVFAWPLVFSCGADASGRLDPERLRWSLAVLVFAVSTAIALYTMLLSRWTSYVPAVYLAPYLTWLAFAAYLNATLIQQAAKKV